MVRIGQFNEFKKYTFRGDEWLAKLGQHDPWCVVTNGNFTLQFHRRHCPNVALNIVISANGTEGTSGQLDGADDRRELRTCDKVNG